MYDPQLIAQAFISGVLMGLLFALVAVGLSLIYGMMDLVNFAHGEMVALGMFTTFWIWKYTELEPLIIVPFTAIVIGVLGILIYKLLIRRLLKAPLAAQMFGTFGLSVFLIGGMQFVFSAAHRMPTPGLMAGSLEVLGVFLPRGRLISGVIALVCFGFLYFLLNKTETGQAILATAQDRQAASLMGINAELMYTLSWGIAGIFAGIAGALLSNMFSVFPNSGFPWAMAAYVSVVLGGFGSVTGAFVGAILVGVIQITSSILILPQLKLIILYTVFVVILFVRPKGLMGVS
jgi:branched-chain amino acid transport system permease protein